MKLWRVPSTHSWEPPQTWPASAASGRQGLALMEKLYALQKSASLERKAAVQRGCPIAKSIIRRGKPEEKYLCVVRRRPSHVCPTAVLVVAIVACEGVEASQADSQYDYHTATLPKSGCASTSTWV